MGNPRCPKCGKNMITKEMSVFSRIDMLGKKVYGRTKFWVCPNKSLLHGLVRYKKGKGVIPQYKEGK